MQWLALILFVPYIYLLLRIYFSLLKAYPFTCSNNPQVFISVIIACRNEARKLPALLSDIAAQDYHPGLFEVIVIDDNSTDSTYSIASSFTGIRNLRVIRNTGSGKKKALRTAAEASAGELILTTDADCRADRKWLSTVASFYSEFQPQMVIGPVAMKGETGFFHRFQELEFMSLQGVTSGTALQGNAVMCSGANLAFTRKSFHENSGRLHEEMVSGDDIFLLQCMKQKKENSILWLESSDAAITTVTERTWHSFFRQRARWIYKTRSYSDRYSVVLAIVTFVTILLLPLLAIAGIFDPVFLLVLITGFVLKSIPDYLIVRNRVSRYNTRNLMRWFFISQIVYPFYIVAIVLTALLKGNSWK